MLHSAMVLLLQIVLNHTINTIIPNHCHHHSISKESTF